MWNWKHAAARPGESIRRQGCCGAACGGPHRTGGDADSAALRLSRRQGLCGEIRGDSLRKGGRTENVLFLHADTDGYKLDSNHDVPVASDDLPALVAAYHGRDANLPIWSGRDLAEDWTARWWFADVDAVRSNDFNLSAARYRPLSQVQAQHQDPRALLDELAAIEAEIVKEVDALRTAIGEAA